MKNNKNAVIALIVLFIIALLITIYPVICNAYLEKHSSEIRTEYFNSIRQLDNSVLKKARKEAEGYNSALANEVSQFDESLLEAAKDYDSILNVNADGVMGYIEIPKINVFLPVGHGTDAETLDHFVGHVIGSSLPVGGKNTHTILSGHSGMANQKMFSDLPALKEGDIFYIHVLDEVLAYRVDKIMTVLPSDTSQLGITKEKDRATLVTCTPFGVNTHRLLVSGERIELEEAAAESENEEDSTIESTWLENYVKGIAIGVIVVLIIVIIVAIAQKWEG